MSSTTSSLAFDPRHILEGHLTALIGHELGPAFPEGKRFAAAALHLTHEENPYPQQKQHGEPGDEQIHIPGGLLGGLGLDADALFAEGRNQFRVFRGEGPEAGATAVDAPNIIPLNGHLLHLSFGHLVEKFAEADLSGWSLRPAEHIKEGDHDQSND